MKITAKRLYLKAQRIVTECGVPEDRFQMYVEPKMLEGERWYIVRLCYTKRGKNTETGVFFKKDCGADGAEMLRKFSWLVEAKTRWLLSGKRVKNQHFYDALWYTAAWELNQNLFCNFWAVIDDEDTATSDRSLLIQWGTRDAPRGRTDVLLFEAADFAKNWYGVYQQLVVTLRKIGREVARSANERGQFPVRLRGR